MAVGELLYKFAVFRNSDVRTDRGRPVELVFFNTHVLTQFYPEKSLSKHRELQLFSRSNT